MCCSFVIQFIVHLTLCSYVLMEDSNSTLVYESVNNTIKDLENVTFNAFSIESTTTQQNISESLINTETTLNIDAFKSENVSLDFPNKYFDSSDTLPVESKLNSTFPSNTIPKSTCYIGDGIINQKKYWYLMWEETFQSEKLDQSQWSINEGLQNCNVSCNVKDNVQLIDGMLAMFAQRRFFDDRHVYTTAEIISKRNFTYGRWEIRMSQPVGGHLRTSINSQMENENGELDLASNIQQNEIIRGIQFANNTTKYELANQKFRNAKSINLNEFHLYGIEWNHNIIRFFFDDFYSRPIKLNVDNLRSVETFHSFRFQLDVGGPFFPNPIPELFDELHWKCPAMIVDYIRVYKQVNLPANYPNQTNIHKCDGDWFNTVEEREIIDKICQIAHNKSDERKNSESFLSSFKRIAVISIIVILLFLILLIIIITKLNNMKQKATIQEPDHTFVHYSGSIEKQSENLCSYEHFDENNIHRGSELSRPDPCTQSSLRDEFKYIQIAQNAISSDVTLESFPTLSSQRKNN
ncbi:Beta Gamma crystallin [Blomia tropicalis]|nr:Beta Gamma crystallin [Blomia tropicalis]